MTYGICVLFGESVLDQLKENIPENEIPFKLRDPMLSQMDNCRAEYKCVVSDGSQLVNAIWMTFKLLAAAVERAAMSSEADAGPEDTQI